MSDCTFCREYENKYDRINDKPLEVLLENKSFWVKLDPNPVSKGHALIVSKGHIEDIFGLNPEESASYLDILKQTKQLLDERFRPDGYNVGCNAGKAAGQTIPHLHIHVIPRYKGDVPNPRGGVRNIIPGKGDYRAYEH